MKTINYVILIIVIAILGITIVFLTKKNGATKSIKVETVTLILDDNLETETSNLSKINQSQKPSHTIEVSKYYTDYTVNDESGDMSGSVMMRFELMPENNYEAFVEQRYGTEGDTYPEQKVENLLINSDGKISFTVLWFEYDWSSNLTKSQKVSFEGTISANQLIILGDLPDSEELILNSL